MLLIGPGIDEVYLTSRQHRVECTADNVKGRLILRDVRTELDLSASAADIVAYLPLGPTVIAPDGGELRAKP